MERIVEEFISKPNLGFQFSHGARPDTDIFHCRGAFSLGSYGEMNALAQAVRKSTEKNIVLDFRDVAHIDSSGIGTIAVILKDMHAASRDLRIVPSTPVRLALGLVKIDTLLRLDQTLDAALEG